MAIATSSGVLNFFQRNYDEAISDFQAALTLDEKFYLAHYFLGLTYAERRMYDESVHELQLAADVDPGSPDVIAALGYKGALAGHIIEAQYALEALARLNKERYVSPVIVAQLQAGLKDYDSAIANLEVAYRLRSTDLIWINVHPAFEPIRSDPRYMDLVNKIGLIKADQSLRQGRR